MVGLEAPSKVATTQQKLRCHLHVSRWVVSSFIYRVPLLCVPSNDLLNFLHGSSRVYRPRIGQFGFSTTFHALR